MLLFEKIEGTKQQIDTLIDLLGKRKHSISHGPMPEYVEHKSFVLNHPYREWFLVKYNQTFVGSVYLTQENHISIFVLPDFYGQFVHILEWITAEFPALPERKSVRPSCYQMNVPVGDVEIVNILERLGCRKIQTTYLVK